MSIIGSLFSNSASSVVKEVGNALDKVFTSDEEILSKQVIIERLNSELSKGQIDLNKIESQHRSIFISGWRPFIGWVCGIGLFYEFLLKPIISSFNIHIESVNIEALHSLVIAMLGMGTLRTFEKIKDKTK